ncbi:DUF3265 domain-containing protein [Vibrio campbellii]|uniref:DUF3265 domain-containing protein n=1 Tax=Vibrio campbellii TaxID=680 RepID=A0ABY5ICZ7_9VIBR|nr:DUF3265 domain-containing protein [Vibrio campbellii]
MQIFTLSQKLVGLTAFQVCLLSRKRWAKGITNCSRVIRHAWHFYYATSLVVKVVCGGFGIVCLTP